MCHSGSCLPVNNCLEAIQVRCGCKRINQQIPCYETNATKNYRLPCDELCAELKKNRIVTPPTPPVVVQTIVEEAKPSVEVDSPITKRKNRKNNNVETTPSSRKKSRQPRFVWTLNKVIVLFGLFTFITVSLIIYMFNQIS